ncbi:MAG: hypothetical protein GTO63_06355 [Anaerolineae bacterium]|nr:hypothetical protein [Anaerolineae bacterium]NIN94594.1 hypothetical protein [Anaerolineae bacterium]NIQ77655.1 hypothetical protein [Anaerolineae bacterium]
MTFSRKWTPLLLALCLIGLGTSDVAAQEACFTELPCKEEGQVKKAVIFTAEKLERCEYYKRAAEGFPALRTSFEALSVSAAQCTGQLDLLAAQYEAEKLRADALSAELNSRWPWYVWAGIGAGLVVSAELVLFFVLK